MAFMCKIFYFSVASLHLIPKVSFLWQLLGWQEEKETVWSSPEMMVAPSLGTQTYNGSLQFVLTTQGLDRVGDNEGPG